MPILLTPDPDRDTRIAAVRAQVADTYTSGLDGPTSTFAMPAPAESIPPGIAKPQLEALFTRLLRQRAAELATGHWNYFEMCGIALGIIYRAALAPRNCDERAVAAALEAVPLWPVLMHARAAAETVCQAQDETQGDLP